MKRLSIIAFATISMLLSAFFPYFIVAETEDIDVFTQDHLSQIESVEQERVYLVQVAVLGDAVFAYFSNSAVYKWEVSSPTPQPFCTLPKQPVVGGFTYKDYDSLSTEVKAQWDITVDCIAAGEGALWGFNVTSGKIGKITETGIHWSTVRLDVAPLMPEGVTWPLRTPSAFVERDTLYVFVALDDGVYPQNNYQLLAFSLSDGSYRLIDIPNVQGYSTYKPGYVLVIQWLSDDTRVFGVLELSTGMISNLPIKIPMLRSGVSVGGIAYDEKSESILISIEGQVWACNTEDKPEKVAFVPMPYIVGETSAWILSDGRYAIGDNALYVRSISRASKISEPLTIRGAGADAVYADFIKENPDCPVIFYQTEYWPSCDEIAQAIQTGDTSWDIYAVIVDNTFQKLKTKGYAGDMSDSKIISSDIQTMYPLVQRVVTDASGRPVAYPYLLYTGQPKVNKGLWNLAFGDEPLPVTYGQFFDAMLRWESEIADSFPEIEFVFDFDHAYYVKKVLDAYAMLYEHHNQPLALDNLELKSVLEKLEHVCNARIKHGKSTEFTNGDGWEIAQIFSDRGLNNVLVNNEVPVLVQSSDFYRDVYLYDQSDMQPLVFAQDDKPVIQGQLFVWFINPNTERKELALRYIEYAARMRNNPITFYAMHPEANDPLENKGFAAQVSDMLKRRSTLLKDIEDASGTERRDIEDALLYIDNWLAAQEASKWEISKKSIEEFRAYAPLIRYFEDFIYVRPRNNEKPQLLDDLFERYTSGLIGLDSFLSEYDKKMQMIYFEEQ